MKIKKLKNRQNHIKMQFKLTILCAIVGLAVAQRGHYAGVNRAITGSRYQDTSLDARYQDTSLNAASNNFAAPNQGFLDNRFSESEYPMSQQQPFGFGSGFGSPYQGFNGNFYQQPQFPFAPFGYNGRR